MYNYTRRKLIFSYFEREGPQNSQGVVSERWLCGVPLTTEFMGYPPLITVGTMRDVHVFMHNCLKYIL
jgi:hypothetical protein